MFDKKMPNIELLKNIIQLSVTNMHPDPSNRYTIKETKEKLYRILENINDSQIIIKSGKGKKDRIVHCSPLVYKQYLKYNINIPV